MFLHCFACGATIDPSRHDVRKGCPKCQSYEISGMPIEKRAEYKERRENGELEGTTDYYTP